MPVEGRSLSSEPTRKAERDRRLGDLSTPESVQRLRTAFHAKAKDEPDFRFYALYDKIYRPDVLEHAYARCRANMGAAGVDGITFEAVRRMGENAGSGNLRNNSERRAMARTQYDGSIFQSRTANRGLSAFRGWRTGYARWQPCWSSNLSSRPTCHLSNTPTGKTGVHRTPCVECTGF